MILIKNRHKYPESTIFCGIMERVMELPCLNIPVDIHIDVGNTNINTEDKIKLAENIQSAVRDVLLFNLSYSENEDLHTRQINIK